MASRLVPSQLRYLRVLWAPRWARIYQVSTMVSTLLIEFRSKHRSDYTWTEQATDNTRTSINFAPGSSTEIRVAAETWVGRSKFSDIFIIEFVEVNIRQEKLQRRSSA